jgi:hypothetical protein
VPAVPLLPNIHSLVDNLYKPYDIGQVGQLDVHILTELFGGEQTAGDLTPAWDGGIYWAGQRLSAKTAAEHHPMDKDPSMGTPEEHASTNSIALFYLSAWKNSASAKVFARIYADELGRKYSGVKLDSADERAGPSSPSAGYTVFPPPNFSDQEQVYSTSEGPVVITTRGKMVFVAESFPLDLARKLTALILDAQGSGELKMAETTPPRAPAFDAATWQPLTGNLVHFISSCGVMKAAVDAAFRGAVSIR